MKSQHKHGLFSHKLNCSYYDPQRSDHVSDNVEFKSKKYCIVILFYILYIFYSAHEHLFFIFITVLKLHFTFNIFIVLLLLNIKLWRLLSFLFIKMALLRVCFMYNFIIFCIIFSIRKSKKDDVTFSKRYVVFWFLYF